MIRLADAAQRFRDRLAAFLYWAAYWLDRAADRLWYGNDGATHVAFRAPIREVTLAEFEALTKGKP